MFLLPWKTFGFPLDWLNIFFYTYRIVVLVLVLVLNRSGVWCCESRKWFGSSSAWPPTTRFLSIGSSAWPLTLGPLWTAADLVAVGFLKRRSDTFETTEGKMFSGCKFKSMCWCAAGATGVRRENRGLLWPGTRVGFTSCAAPHSRLVRSLPFKCLFTILDTNSWEMIFLPRVVWMLPSAGFFFLFCSSCVSVIFSWKIFLGCFDAKRLLYQRGAKWCFVSPFSSKHQSEMYFLFSLPQE